MQRVRLISIVHANSNFDGGKEKHTKLKTDISGSEQDLDLIVYLIIAFPPSPETLVLLFEIRLVDGGEVGFNVAENLSI